ncbi:acetyl-CoA synthetase-like protein [Fomitiporia mediterranea MF3/22]|uniref:acetyl-CoA synthetase-like protein n=1 Tax=Fomitiporia mediterranea (strain MF3/22) TaxID=694068 RepID=UPI0004408CF5|nr:acetyl-CoA synthetase-like protein [Fomitiporia mediterranea MF3/22]EJC99607.1 acetyl-CoA synthetase-like protein [Fomitiporia mediterranea MF3/22]
MGRATQGLDAKSTQLFESVHCIEKRIGFGKHKGYKKYQGPQISFIRPPLRGSLTIPELYDWHYEHNRNYPLFIYEDEPGIIRSISMGEAVQGLHRATQYLRECTGDVLDIQLSEESTKQPVIAILAASDTISFFCAYIGGLRTGATIFPISTRNSAPAVAFLLSRTKPIAILVSPEPTLQQLADDSIGASECADLRQIAMPTFNDLFPNAGLDPQFKPVPSAKLTMDSHAVIYHSSGTTSFPKPVYWTHRALSCVSILPLSGEVDVSGTIFGCHSTPLFHALGALLIAFPASIGVCLALFKPQSPAVVPNPVNVFEAALVAETDYLFSPPSFVETWSQVDHYVDELSKMKGVVYGGGPLAKHAGDHLASRGVNIYQTYASTETAGLSAFLPEHPGMAWEYFKFLSDRKIRLEPFSENEFRVIVLESDNFKPFSINTKVNGVDGYASDDLVSPHPTKLGYFKIVGRADDQIIHSNGEKTNPGPLETMLKQDSQIEDAIMFGRGRFQCGVLIQPSKAYPVDHFDTVELEKFRNAIWPTVEKVNAFAPGHSRLFKEMIIVASPEKPFQYTAKRSLRRQVVLEAYSKEIDKLYTIVNDSAQVDIAPPKDWSESSVLDFIRDVVAQTMKKEMCYLGDENDLFEHGADSLQATWIRNTIIRALRGSHPKLAHAVSPNFVYENPTISGLANQVALIITGHATSEANSLSAKKNELLKLVEKYTDSFPDFFPSPKENADGHVVLLTGSTGSLGSNLLATLLQSSSVSIVYALSRHSDKPVLDRLKSAFEKEDLALKLLHSNKLKTIEGDPSDSGFGIEPERYAELQGTVSHVIHNAWRVNFSNSIASFESNIRSVRNFIDFCLGCKGTSPARLVFISSISVFQQSLSKTAEPEELLSIEDVRLGSGYGESKWVAEQILAEAARRTPLKMTIIRPGQLTGGTTGAWNEHEWFPSLIKSSIVLGMLPSLDGVISWITTDIAVRAILEMLQSEEQVFHLAHPHPVKWNEVIQWFSKSLGVVVVTYREWIEALDQSNKSAQSGSVSELEVALKKNPALRLLDLFRSVIGTLGKADDPFGSPTLALEHASRISSVLRNAVPINGKNVERWVIFWKKTGFLN